MPRWIADGLHRGVKPLLPLHFSSGVGPHRQVKLVRFAGLRVHSCLFAVLGLLLGAWARASELDEAWQSPPAEARPWVMWYWMKGAVSAEGVTADLEAMKEAGLAGAYLASINAPDDPPHFSPALRTLTPAWWDMLRHTFREADRLGLKIVLHHCDGFATAAGPWITPELSMQKLVWSEQRVSGGAPVSTILERPETREDYYRDLAVLAVPLAAGHEVTTATQVPVVTTSWPGVDAQFLVEPLTEKQVRTTEAGWIQYAFGEPFTARSLVIKNWSHNYGGLYHATRLAVEVSDDSVRFRPHFQLQPPRHGWQDWGGDYTFALPPVTARYFRFVFDPAGSEPGSEDLNGAKWRARLIVRGLELSSAPRLDNYEGKSAMAWRLAAPTTEAQIPPELAVPRSAVIDLTSRMGPSGTLRWTPPPGRWAILRFGYTSTGQRNETAGAGKGLEADKFNPEAARVQFDGWLGETLRQVGPELAKRVMPAFYIDSWEAGSQNWSPVFRDEFTRRRGYDPVPWLPTMAGVPLESAAASERFLHDVRATIAELVNDNFFGTYRQLADAHGLRFAAEATAPTMPADGMRHFTHVDYPMGEFWLRSETHDKPNDIHDAIAGARVYGRRIVQAEAFTQLRVRWDEHPGLLKPLADEHFARGVNRLVHHVFTQNPWLDRRPGMTLNGVGLVFQRGQTWWPEVGAWNDYVARVSALLQLGRPVEDVAYFTGEELPSRALLPERFRPSLPDGYAGGSVNRDALLRLARVESGRLVFPGGASYAVLVVPGRAAGSPELAVRLDRFEREGLAIVGTEADLAATLAGRGLRPALLGSEHGRALRWIQRRAGEAMLTFVANPAAETRTFALTLRDAPGPVSFWEPVSGRRERLDAARTGAGLHVAVTLPPHGSGFVVIGAGEGEAPFAATATQPIAGPWDVTWTDPFEGSEVRRTLTTLRDWRELDDLAGFSGTATYRTTFTVHERPAQGFLSLGEVHHVARVVVNGVDCGVAWTPPYRVDISSALRPGENTLDVRITNTWANRLRAEQVKPEAERRGWTLVPAGQILPEPIASGLLGPVKLK